jgi:hypothetical protein
LRQCQILYNKYGLEKGIEIVKRWKELNALRDLK